MMLYGGTMIDPSYRKMHHFLYLDKKKKIPDMISDVLTTRALVVWIMVDGDP